MLARLFDRITRGAIPLYALTIFLAWLLLLPGFFAARELKQDLLPRVGRTAAPDCKPTFLRAIF